MNILVLGGNGYFGQILAQHCLSSGYALTLLNRGNVDDELGDQVRRIRCDRRDKAALARATEKKHWDIVYDQVCFDYETANAACSIFSDRASRYIFTSSQSVYPLGARLHEKQFDAVRHPIKQYVSKDEDYSEAKRQAECAFAHLSKIPTAMVRFPIVVGAKDPSKRIHFHVDRIREGRSIGFPNIDSKLSLIHSQDAAKALMALGLSDFCGPVNVASPSPMSLREFIGIIENVIGKEALVSTSAEESARSPYGVAGDWFMDCNLASTLGLNPKEISEWLPGVVSQLERG